MKKKTVNAFTLVEMLIVIVIIGILIAALMPRMQAAQWRARDVSRKTALSQIQSAIVTSQWDKWKWPWQDIWATGWIAISAISWDLTRAWMNSVPVDPLKSKVTWAWKFQWNTWWDYWYIVTYRNWSKNWWFALMAKTEVEWWSNWVVCASGTNVCSEAWWPAGCITWGTDIAKIRLCETLSGGTSTSICSNDYNGNCSYRNDSELRYLVVY